MNPSNDALVQQMLQQNQMLMQMVLAHCAATRRPAAGPVRGAATASSSRATACRPARASPGGAKGTRGDSASGCPTIRTNKIRPIYETDACRGNAISADDRPLRDQPSSLKAERRILVFNSEGDVNSEDFRSCGYRMKQINGGRIIGKTILVRDSHLIRPDCKVRGTKDFQMRTYVDSRQPGVALVHFIGDETLAVDFPHGNSKTGDVYVRTAPSVLRAFI